MPEEYLSWHVRYMAEHPLAAGGAEGEAVARLTDELAELEGAAKETKELR